MPAFRFRGKVVTGFAATKSGCSYLPFESYSQTKSALHFDPAKGLPVRLLRKLLCARIAELT
jgi:hypothetical protein